MDSVKFRKKSTLLLAKVDIIFFMKKIILLIFLSTTYILANINAIVSIVPLQTFVKAIGGERVDISLMVQAHNSPHTYEPKASQMIAVAKADLYFAIGVEFEHVWLPKFKSLNDGMKIIDLSKGVEKISMIHSHEEHHEGKDPHIWTDPHNVKIIVHAIYDILSNVDVNNSSYYKKNLDTFLEQINKTDEEIRMLLNPSSTKHQFMVFHPSWGYFAKAYNLEQIAVEVEGKSPKPRAIVRLIKQAKKKRVTAIFTQPEFSDASAKIIAHTLHIPVVKKTPLAPNWSQNLISIAKIIAGKN